MAKITPDGKTYMEKEFENLSDEVYINVHIPSDKSESSEGLKEVMESLAESSEKITVSYIEEDSAEDGGFDYMPERLPAAVVLDKDKKDYGIIFYGTPTLGVFRAFVRVVVMLSTGKKDLEDEMAEKVGELEKTELQVLVTPSTPKCDETIMVAANFAFCSEGTRCSITELIEFPEIAERYEVLGVPKTIVDEEVRFTGSYDAAELLKIIQERITDVEE